MERGKGRGGLASETKNKTSPMPPTIAKSGTRGSRKMADCLRVIIGLYLFRCYWLGLRRSRTLEITQISVCIQTLRLVFSGHLEIITIAVASGVIAGSAPVTGI